MPSRALGYRPDPPKGPGEKPDYRILLSTAAPLPPSCNNRDLIVEVLNQGALGSCTANATMQAVRASQARQWKEAGGVGEPPPLGSRLWLYYLSRALSAETETDAGTFLRFCFQTLNEHGFCPESVWPYADTGDRWHTMPSKAAMRAAYDQKIAALGPNARTGEVDTGFAYFRIYEEGDDRIAAVKRALSTRQLVVFGTDVSDEFCNDDFGTQPVDPTVGHFAGGHAMCAVDYESDVINVVNSWGDGWAENGFFKATAESVKAWRDVWIVKAAPFYSAID